MPQQFTAPDGHVYTWDKEEPPTQADFDALLQQDGKRQMLQIQWNNASPLQRIKMYGTWGGDVIKDIGIEAGASVGGQAVGAIVGGKPGSQIGAGLGAGLGNAVVQARNITQGKQDSFKPGQMVGSAVATALTPGGTVARLGEKELMTRGLQNAAANLTGKSAETAIDEQRVPNLKEGVDSGGMGFLSAPLSAKVATGKKALEESTRAAQDIVRNRNLKVAQDFGYVLDPTLANPSSANKIMSRIAGQTQLQREAVFRNQKVTDTIARAEIGLPPDGELSRPSLMQRKFELGEPYREVAKIDQQAAADLKELQAERVASRDNWKRYARDGDPAFRDKAKTADTNASNLETKLETHALNAQKPALVEELRTARKLLAKTHVIEAALNPADGHVSATVIGAMYDKGKKLSDGLEIIANMENMMPQVMREAAVTQSVGSQSFRPFLAAGAYAAGMQATGSPMVGAAGAGAVAFGDAPARNLMLSNPYQKFMNTPRYNTTQPGMAEAFLRYSTQAAGRK